MVFYFVQPGETLLAIARRYQTTVHAIVTANRLKDPNALSPGQALIIPRPGERPSPSPGGVVHLVRPGETLIELAARFGTTVRAILLANQIAHPEFVLPGQQLVIPEPPEPGVDWPVHGRTPGRSGATAVSLRGELRAVWSFAPQRGGGLRPSGPVTRYDRVYVGLSDGYYYSVDRHTGDLKWRVPAFADQEGPPAVDGALATPAIYDGLAYLCGIDGCLRAVDAHTGRRVWQVALGADPTGAPLAADGILYCGSAGGDALAVEAKTGALAWRRRLDGPVSQPVALGDATLLAVTDERSLWAIDALSGEVRWRRDCVGPHPPVFADLLVIVGGRAYHPLSGQLIWERPDPGCSPVVREDRVFYPGLEVDLFSGEARAEGEAVAAGVLSHLLAGDLQVWTTADGRAVGWDPLARAERWSIRLDGPATGVAVAPGSLFLSLADGVVLAYGAHGEE